MQLVQQLEHAVGDAECDVDVQSVLNAVEIFLEDGFVGNRSVKDIWSLITRTSAAYPLLLNNLLETVLDNCRGQLLDKQQLQQKWIAQAIFHGKLGAFISKVPQQPHIKTAYHQEASILQPEIAQQWSVVILKLAHHEAFADGSAKKVVTVNGGVEHPPAELQVESTQPEVAAGDGACGDPTVRVQLLVQDVAGGCEEGGPVRLKLTLSEVAAASGCSGRPTDAQTALSSSGPTDGTAGSAPTASRPDGRESDITDEDASKPPRPGPHPVISWGRGLFMQVLSHRGRSASEEKGEPEADAAPTAPGNSNAARREASTAEASAGASCADSADAHESEGTTQAEEQRVHAGRGTGEQAHSDGINAEALDSASNAPHHAATGSAHHEPHPAAASSADDAQAAQDSHDHAAAHCKGKGSEDGSDKAQKLMDEDSEGRTAQAVNSIAKISSERHAKAEKSKEEAESKQQRSIAVAGTERVAAFEGNRPLAGAQSAANRWLGALFRRTQQQQQQQQQQQLKENKQEAKLEDIEGAPSVDHRRADKGRKESAVQAEVEGKGADGTIGEHEGVHDGAEKQAEGSGPIPPPLAAAGRLLHNMSRRSVDDGKEPKLLHFTIRLLHDDGDEDDDATESGAGKSGGQQADEMKRFIEVSIELAEDNQLEHHIRAWSQAAAQAAVGAAGVIAQQAAHKAPILWQYIREHAEQHLLIVPPTNNPRAHDAGDNSKAGPGTEQVPVQDTPEYKDGVKEAAELLQQVQQCVEQLLEVESNSKFVLGDESSALIALCHIVEKVLLHGLRQEYQWTQHWIKSQPLLSWIPTPHPHPFSMLGELQKGRRPGRSQGPNPQQSDPAATSSASAPPLDLGVDAVHGMRMAAGVSESTKLQLWIRVSLNQQLLGKRIQLLFEYAHSRGSWQVTKPDVPADAAEPNTASHDVESQDSGIAGQHETKTAGSECLSGSPLDAWFHPWALLRLEKVMEEAAAKLAQVDGVRSLLAVDVQSVRPAAIKAVPATGGNDSADGLSGAQFDWPISPTSTFSEADSTAGMAAPTITLPRPPSLSRPSKGREKRVVEIHTAAGGKEQAFSPRSSAGVLSPVSSSEFNIDMFDQLAADMDTAHSAGWNEPATQMVEPLAPPSGLKLPSLDLLSLLQPRVGGGHSRPSPKKQALAADSTSALRSVSFEYGMALDQPSAIPEASPATQTQHAGLMPATSAVRDEPDGHEKQESSPPPVASPSTRQQREAVDAVLASLNEALPLEGVALEPEVLEGTPITGQEDNPLLAAATAASNTLLGSEEEEELEGTASGEEDESVSGAAGSTEDNAPTCPLQPQDPPDPSASLLAPIALDAHHPPATGAAHSHQAHTSDDTPTHQHHRIPPPASPRTTADSLPDSAASSRGSTMTDLSADKAPSATRPLVPHRGSNSGQSVGGQQVVSLAVVASHTLQDSRGGEFTVYDVQVELQDGTKYRVQHRFSDFVNLRHSLKYNVGAVLPDSWSDISKARHVTGRARISNEVVHARQAMLDRCLRDVMHVPPAVLNTRVMKQFLAPQSGDVVVQPSAAPSNPTSATVSTSAPAAAPRAPEARSTIRLQFELSSGRSPAEQFRIQQGNCASCHCPLPALDDSYSLWRQGNTRGPRVCHYTHMLYCQDCHEGHMHIIPARILHKWDFSRHPVCVAVHEYLQAVFHQPMISITAINPGLYARVPTMAKAYELRHKTVLALDLARTSGPEAAAKVQKLLEVAGSRAYLLEKADFWSLRDLQDISKGAFSEIPQWLEAASHRATTIATSAVLTNKNQGK